MKKFKAILALVLVAALFVTLFAACAQNTETPSTDTGKENTNTNTNTGSEDKQPADSEDKEPAGDEGNDAPPADEGGEEEPVDPKKELIDWEDPVTLQMWFYCNSQSKGEASVTDPVLEAINAILLEEINAQIEWTLLMPADYQSKVGLALGGGETIDVMGTMPLGRISNWYNQGMLTDITDLAPVYMPGAMEIVDGLTGGYTFGGRLYGIPTMRNLPIFNLVMFGAEYLEQAGVKEQFRNAKSYEDLEVVLEALKTKGPEGMYPLGGDATGIGLPSMLDTMVFSEYKAIETIGESTGTVFVEDGKVQMIQGDSRYETSVRMLADWFEKGYIWPDSLYNTQVQKDDLIKNKVICGNMNGSEWGVEAVKEGLIGFDLEVVMVTPTSVTSGAAALWGMCVPITSEEPEAACMLINEMYTNAELMNLFVHGVEGKDHTLVNGEVVYKKEAFYSNGQHVIGNQLLTYPIAGQGADFMEVIKELNATATKSEYMGFTIATGDLQDMIANVNAANEQYKQTMIAGGYTEALYKEYVQKLNDAGWADYAEAIQTQLDAWVAANK